MITANELTLSTHFCLSRFSGHSAKSKFNELDVYKATIGDLTQAAKTGHPRPHEKELPNGR